MNFWHVCVFLFAAASLVQSGPMEQATPPIAILPPKTTISTSLEISKQVIRGQIAILGQIPWQAAIKITKHGGHYFCGGSLIHEKWVLTAGHCTLNASRFEVFLGTLKPYSSDTRLISTLAFTHPGFNGTNMNDDIGLINLPSQVNISANGVMPALQFAPVRLIKRKKCAATFGLHVVSPHTLCSQGKRSPCSGDSGGPLATWGPTPQLVGIVSFIAASGCERGLPAGYIRVSSYRAWIRNVTGITFL